MRARANPPLRLTRIIVRSKTLSELSFLKLSQIGSLRNYFFRSCPKQQNYVLVTGPVAVDVLVIMSPINKSIICFNLNFLIDFHSIDITLLHLYEEGVMKRIKTVLAVGVLALFVGSRPVGATLYTFSQGGYPDGAEITGYFDSPITSGQIAFFGIPGVITDFSLTFSGNSQVPGFTLNGLNYLYGLVYDVGSGYLGDGTTGDIEGIVTQNYSYTYASGMGPLSILGGEIGTGSFFSLTPLTATDNLIQVTSTPEPASILLFGTGIAGLAGIRLRRKKQ